jgi:RNA polymerase sigma factor (TIGR02999 family)
MSHEVSRILEALGRGDDGAMDRLVLLVYEELHAIAETFIAREAPGHTLQPTALVHEAYLRLVDQRVSGWNDRTHFFAAAAQAMRRVLVDHARRKKSEKRGGGKAMVSLDSALVCAYESAAGGADILELDEALAHLAEINSLTARIVELRYFGGPTTAETASVLGTSPSTVEREWRFARAWLRDRLGSDRRR